MRARFSAHNPESDGLSAHVRVEHNHPDYDGVNAITWHDAAHPEPTGSKEWIALHPAIHYGGENLFRRGDTVRAVRGRKLLPGTVGAVTYIRIIRIGWRGYQLWLDGPYVDPNNRWTASTNVELVKRA